eukprot:Seg582.4 transcript_id=Seg582.4/GoldUCD/mRNA.D3Y31 product="Major facilitator superfamily domain-containing protein 6" protein_id=Seg582.4/GoldUCD/D3Y31
MAKEYGLQQEKVGRAEEAMNLLDGKSQEKKSHDETQEISRCTIDPVLLRLKIFYFLFFAGFGTTFPYLGIYFKQIGLSASSVGILAGVRPLIQCASGPLWSMLADKYKARKGVLLFSIVAWLVMTVLLAFPRPHHEVCKAVNATAKGSPHGNGRTQKKDAIPGFHGHMTGILPPPSCFLSRCNFNFNRRVERSAHKDDKSFVISNFVIKDFFNNSKGYNRDFSKDASHEDTRPKQDHTNLNQVSNKSTVGNKSVANEAKVEYVIERNPKEIHDIFIILLILIVVGEFLEAPSFIMTDTALLEYLGEERSRYGTTRLFGSMGYGVASFTIGAVLDHAHYQFCGKTLTNYILLFYIFAGFMIIAFFYALFAVNFNYQKVVHEEEVSFMAVVKLLATVRNGSFLLIAWFMGFSHGGIMNFLNWYLEDLGATRFMMGIGTSCRALAIIIGFTMSNYFINKFGHYNMILFALVAYTLSFFGYSIILNPWYALPIEIAQGICYSMSWSACITYLGAAAPPNTAATVQGILQGIYWGLGTGLGAFAGGEMINTYGAVKSFRIGGIVTAIVVLFFLVMNHFVNKQDQSNVKKDVDSRLKDFKKDVSMIDR